ncbi:MAG: pyridoxamine 5'-phosphate oxidase family protein [Pseudomonadota bacterium]
MAKLDPHIALTSEEIDRVMTTEATCRIATIGPGTDINLTPMTFGWAGGKVYIFGRGQKIANLRRNPTATVLVDTGERWQELTGVMLRGTATVLETAETEAADPDLAAAKANIGTKHGLDGPYPASASGKSRRWIVFEPRRVVSWDNAKLNG